MDKLFHELTATILTVLAGLVPAALGAAVSLAYESGLTWSRRFAQMSVGIVVSYFATGAIGAVFGFGPFVLQAIGFVVGMIAFKATPKFITACSDALASAPSRFVDRILALLPGKDAK